MTVPLEVVYVLELTGLSGGIRNVFEQVNRLYDKGVSVHLFALDKQPTWFPLKVPVRRFANYPSMMHTLKQMNCIKIATWWKTLAAVWHSCDRNKGGRGIPLYLVQDIEESYYPNWNNFQERVRNTYRVPVQMMTIADWTTKQLLERFQKHAHHISIGVDFDLYIPNRTQDYNPFRILACSRRSQHLKGFDITVQAVNRVCAKLSRASLVTFGIESTYIENIPHTHISYPDDQHVAYLYANCGVFVQTSHHEGFGLPILEAMACGAPVVTTKAEGNEEFCHHGKNCILVEKGDVEGVAQGILRILTDSSFATYLANHAMDTAKTYNWPRVMNNLMNVFHSVIPQLPNVKSNERDYLLRRVKNLNHHPF